jgi:hypothetical protein
MIGKLYRNASIKTKLILAFVVMIVLIGAVSIVSLVTQFQARSAASARREVGTNVTENALEARFSLLNAHAEQKNYLIYYNEVGVNEADRRYAPVVTQALRTVRASLEPLRTSAIVTSAEIDNTIDLLESYENAFDNARQLMIERGTGDAGDGLIGELFRTRKALHDFARENGFYDNLAYPALFEEQHIFEGVYFMDIEVTQQSEWLALIERLGQLEPPASVTPEAQQEYMRLFRTHRDAA